MANYPEWLPEIVSVNGEPEKVFRMLYEIFSKDFKESTCRYQTYPVWFDRNIKEGRYEEGFWHLITRKDYSSGERLFDPPRAERLPWCAPAIMHTTNPVIKYWEYKEGGKRINTYIWIEDWDYVIILREKQMRIGKVYFLVTAYYVDGNSSRRSLRKKYSKRIP